MNLEAEQLVAVSITTETPQLHSLAMLKRLAAKAEAEVEVEVHVAEQVTQAAILALDCWSHV